MLAGYQLVFRIGWIFKLESILIPAFLDTLTSAGWMRGLLPVLNRFGQSVPPLYAADWIREYPQKKHIVIGGTLLRACLFLVVAAACWTFSMEGNPIFAWAFLGLYAMFFVSHGISQVAQNTLQGKIIQPTRFGRLMMISDSFGTILAIFIAWLLLGRWLTSPDGFTITFMLTGVCFLLSTIPLMAIREVRDESPAHSPSPRPLEGWKELLKRDGNFRLLVVVAMLYGTMQILMPHYQALGREKVGLQLAELWKCVVAQNVGTGIFSLIAGGAADRFGARAVLRILLLVASLAPATAVVMLLLANAAIGNWFWMIFIFMGIMPVGYRLLTNYTLEISTPADHPRYLSTLNACLAVPFCISPLVGWIADVWGFAPVFATGSILIALGGLLAKHLVEPRHHEPIGGMEELI